MFTSIRVSLVCLSIAVGTLAGCSVGGNGSGASACPAAAEVAANTGGDASRTAIAVAAIDDRFYPRCAVLGAPGTVTIVVRNDGRRPHNLTIDDEHRVAVDAGQVAILDVDVPVGGIRYVCTIHSGMDGELRVAD